MQAKNPSDFDDPAGRMESPCPSKYSAVNPFTVVVDTREQKPYEFEGFRTDRTHSNLPLTVPTVTKKLDSGDYSIVGFENRVAIERKSLEDLYGTLGQGRKRFEKELARLQDLEWAGVVVEANWSKVMYSPPQFSRLRPKTVFRSILAWSQRFSRVHWFTMCNRQLGEAITFRLLERFWRDCGGDQPNITLEDPLVGEDEDG